MKLGSKFFSITIAFMIVFMFTIVVLADNRINQAHHFGGDSLYCDVNVGCWMLDSNGNEIWNVAQSDIETTMMTACETGLSQVMEVGAGTYGLFWIEVSCYEGINPSLALVGYDEHGKINRMRFPTDYTPVFGEEVLPPTPMPTPTMIPTTSPL